MKTISKYFRFAGLPLQPLQCELSSLVKGAWEVKCRQPRFIVPAQNATADDQLDADEGADGDAENDLVIGSSSLVYWLELFDAESGQLLHNVSSPTPRFSVRAIDPAARVAAVVSSVNRQGRSPPVRLEGAVERAVGSRAGQIGLFSSSFFRNLLVSVPFPGTTKSRVQLTTTQYVHCCVSQAQSTDYRSAQASNDSYRAIELMDKKQYCMLLNKSFYSINMTA